MNESSGTVVVIDDDLSMRDVFERLVTSVGLQTELLDSTQGFQQRKPDAGPICLILDVRLRGISGLDFQKGLTEANVRIPIIFVTGFGDVRMAVQAMKAGAVDFLTKPFREQELLDAIYEGLENDRTEKRRQMEIAVLHEQVNALTRREREVLPLVASGLLNKQVASTIGISEAAAKVHRSQLLRKMGARSVAELVRIAMKLEIVSLD